MNAAAFGIRAAVKAPARAGVGPKQAEAIADTARVAEFEDIAAT